MKRYRHRDTNPDGDCPQMRTEEHPFGDWVKYDDAKAEIERLHELEAEIAHKDKAFEDYADCCEGQIKSLQAEKNNQKTTIIKHDVVYADQVQIIKTMKTRMHELEAENQRLRYALDRIKSHLRLPDRIKEHTCHKIAREALGGESD